MTTTPTVIIAGDQSLVAVLRGTGRFAEVHAVDSAWALGATARNPGEQIAYVFAPGFVDDRTAGGAAALAGTLAASGHRVVVHSAIGDLSRLNPSVVILNWPVDVQILLTALGVGSRDDVAVAPLNSGDAGGSFDLEAPGPDQADPPPSSAAGPRAAKVLAVTAPTGGTGKSTLAANLAAFGAKRLQASGRSVAVLDFNLQQPDIGRLLGQGSPTIMDLLDDPAGLDPASIAAGLARLPDVGLSALLGAPSPEAALPSVLNAELCRQILSALRPLFDYIVIDTPVAEFHHQLFTDVVLAQADALIVPVAPNLAALDKTRAWLGAITAPHHAGGGGIPSERVTLILNRARLGVGCDPEQVQQAMAAWRFAGMIPEDERWPRAANTGQLLALSADRYLGAVLAGIWHHTTADPAFAPHTDAVKTRRLPHRPRRAPRAE